MQSNRRAIVLATTLAMALTTSVQIALAHKKNRQNAAAEMEEQKRAVHLLNRLSFGPRPGDVERVTAMGVDKWIDLQLHPDRIDDSALNARLEPLRTLRMDTREIVENFPPPANHQSNRGRQGIPSIRPDPAGNLPGSTRTLLPAPGTQTGRGQQRRRVRQRSQQFFSNSGNDGRSCQERNHEQ